jgi:hypothetical protein
MSYPFKGFESSEWVRVGKSSGHARQLKSKVGSLQAMVAQGCQQDLARVEELEGKHHWLSVVEHFFEACFLSPAIIRAEK